MDGQGLSHVCEVPAAEYSASVFPRCGAECVGSNQFTYRKCSCVVVLCELNPLPMLLLSTSYHVCACNRQFCRQLNYRPRDLIGIMFQNVLFKIDVDMLPRMLQFEYVESISVKRRPQKSDVQGTSKLGMGSCVKMDVYISQIGKEGMAFKLAKPSRVVNAPLYVLTFMKSGSSSVIAT
uniref:PAS domain-containing protein n=1 Tax=Percolomonas cosmopolitus TaxID=63605 RepID=A0A7S1KRI3_9EUKA|mmetsp:Transcript_6196/g.23408  ORF Transcript_6196/g.23408 Transcript_6196/m.23408 type:complete len:179 (+) Transcript_6196:1992-2528(+)